MSNIEINQPRRPRETISLSHFIPKNLSVSLDQGACRNVYTASRSQYTCTRDRGKGRTSVDLASDWSRGLSPHPPLTWSSPSLSSTSKPPPPPSPTPRHPGDIFSIFLRVPLLLFLLLLVPFFGRFVRAQAGIFDHPADHQQRPDHPRPRVEKKPIPRPFSSFSSISPASSFFFFFFSFFLASNRGARIGPWIISRAYSCFVRGSGDGIFRIVQSSVCLRYFAWKLIGFFLKCERRGRLRLSKLLRICRRFILLESY